MYQSLLEYEQHSNAIAPPKSSAIAVAIDAATAVNKMMFLNPLLIYRLVASDKLFSCDDS